MRPGGALASRPLHFYWIVDASASMGEDGKMQSLNEAVLKALPAMRDAAADNPNATVRLRVLRFSDQATWLQSEPVSISQFQWQLLQADQLAPGMEFSSEFRRRLEREGAQSGDVTISLSWDNFNDLDLHVFTPSGEEIWFRHRESSCGGMLDVDMNVTPTSDTPVENVFWPTNGAPVGTYRVVVHHFRKHNKPKSEDPTAYRVAIKNGHRVSEISGSISAGTKAEVTSFEFGGAGPVGTTAGGNTSLGAAIKLLADELHIDNMPNRGLPPVCLLLSDGQPTDEYASHLQRLLQLPWGKRAVRLAIAIGGDADQEALEHFIANREVPVLSANNPEALTAYIRWASTEVLRAASMPASQAAGQALTSNVPVPAPPETSASDVW